MAKRIPNDTTFVRWSPHPAFQSAGLSPLLVTGILIQELRNHFQPGKIEDPRCVDYVWKPIKRDNTTPSPKDTGIMIEPWSSPVKRESGMVPYVQVKRVQYSSGPSFLNSDAYVTNMAGMEVPIAGENHTKVIQGRHHIGVTCDESAAVELILWEIYRHFEFFHDPIMAEYGFGEFKISGVEEQNYKEANKNGYDVAVVVEYAFNVNWVVAEIAPRMSGAAVITEN